MTTCPVKILRQGVEQECGKPSLTDRPACADHKANFRPVMDDLGKPVSPENPLYGFFQNRE